MGTFAAKASAKAASSQGWLCHHGAVSLAASEAAVAGTPGALYAGPGQQAGTWVAAVNLGPEVRRYQLTRKSNGNWVINMLLRYF